MKSIKRMRLPNGFGQISEIKNRKLRKPFRVLVTVGKNSNGRPICKPLKPESYFRTYNEAYAALVEYNKNPYDLDSIITVSELYERWTEEYFKTLKKDSIRSITSTWVYCSSVYNMRVIDLRARHIKGCINEGVAMINGKEKKPSSSIKLRIKSTFNNMLDYALEYELVDKNYSRAFNISEDVIREKEKNTKNHIPFTDEEIEILWSNLDKKKYIDIILIQCYSGWRPQELGLLRVEDINLDDGIIIGGIKTNSGTNRIVPIHSKIYSLVERRYKEAIKLNSEYLFNCVGDKRKDLFLTYDKYKGRFDKIKTELKLNPEHKPHDGRTYFVTIAKKYNVDEYAIKYIVGHSISDITEKVYTKRDIEWLKNEIEKIK